MVKLFAQQQGTGKILLTKNLREDWMIKVKLWFCLIFIATLTACTGNTTSTSNYALVVQAWRGELLFAHRVIYAVDERGSLLNLNIPQEKELGSYFEWSPDGQWIAHSIINPNPRYISDADIYLIRVHNPKQTVRVTNTLGADGTPTWSPDGSKIAFYAYNEKIRNNAIYLLDVKCILLSKDCSQESTFLAEGVNPDWSPDGKKIVYQGGYGAAHRGIYVVDVQNPSEPIKIGECDGSPQWSPDGKKIISFCKGTIQIIDPNGDNIVKYAIDGLNPKWSPDGKKIAFIGMETLDSHLGKPLDIEGNILSTALFIMDANGTNITRITKSNEETIRWFTWIATDSLKVK